MTTNPEVSKNNPTSAPSKTSSDTLLKNFHSILDQRWKEFDAAVVAEAGIAASFRGTDERYIKAKATFDEAKAIGNAMKDDDMLKTALNSPGRLGLLIDELNVYFKEIKEADKTKQYNHVLGNTLTDLTTLRSQVTQAPQDQLKAKEVATAVAALPAATVVLGGTGVGGIMAELQSEVTGEIKKELGPWGMIFKGVDGVPTKDVAEQVKNLSKEYSEKKWTSDPFEKLMLKFQLLFLSFRIGNAGMDLSGDMTPEEMKLVGIKGGKGKEEEKKGKEEEKKPSDKYTGSRYIFQGLFLNEQLPITDILDTEKFKNSKIQELYKVHTSKKYKEYLSTTGMKYNDSHVQALTRILEVTFTGKPSVYILEAYNSSVKIPKKSPIPNDVTFGVYITAASTILKSMYGLAKAAATQKMQQPNVVQNTDGSIEIKNKDEENEHVTLIDGDKKLLGFMLGTNATSKYTIGKRDEFLQNLAINEQFKALYPNPEEKIKATATINKILDFSDTFMKGIQSNSDIHLGMSNELGQVINGKALNLKGLMLIYLSMQGKNISNFNEFSTIEQAGVYTIVTTIFNIPGNNIDNGKNTANYLDALNDTTRPIPSGVKEFMADSTKYIADKSVNGIWESIKYVTGMASASPKLALGFAAMNIPFVPARNSVADLLF